MSLTVRVGTVLLAVLALATGAIAQFPQLQVQQIGPNYFVAGVPGAEFRHFAARQRSQNWCWAATIQMVLNYHGLYVTQEQVVARVFGRLIDRPGRPEDILSALSGWAPDVRGRYSSIQASPFVFRGSEVVRDLMTRWPLIVGLRPPPNAPRGTPGHAFVLTAAYYSVDRFNEPVFLGVVLRDPWPGSPSRQEMTWLEFESRLMFVARVRVTRH